MKDYILTIGTSMIDIYGYSPNCDALVGCNPGSVKISFGGVGRNIVENLLRIDVPTKFISVFGNDGYGNEMIEQLKYLNCDLNDSIIVDAQSATFLGIIGHKHEVLKAIADSHIMKNLTLTYLKSKADIINNAPYIIFDSNDYELFDQFVHFYKDTKIIIDPVSPVKAKKIKHLLPYFHTIKPNKLEAEALCGFELNTDCDLQKAGNYFLSIGVKKIFITLGDAGVYFTDGIEEGVMKVIDVEVKNEVGAGDAFVAGIGYGYLHQLSLVDTTKFAYSMALISLLSEQTVSSEMNLNKVLVKANEVNFTIQYFK